MIPEKIITDLEDLDIGFERVQKCLLCENFAKANRYGYCKVSNINLVYYSEMPDPINLPSYTCPLKKWSK